MQHTTVIYEGTPGQRLRTERIDIVGATSDGIEQALQQAIDGDSNRIELCGGIGTPEAARAQEVVADRVQLRLVRYGFESLERIADYKRAFAAGDVRPAVFLYPEADGGEPVEHDAASAVLRGADGTVPVGFVEL